MRKQFVSIPEEFMEEDIFLIFLADNPQSVPFKSNSEDAEAERLKARTRK